MRQWASALVGTAVTGAIGGDGQTGASTAASGTKNNNLLETQPEQMMSLVMAGVVVGYIKTYNGMKVMLDATGQAVVAVMDAAGEWIRPETPSASANVGSSTNQYETGIDKDFWNPQMSTQTPETSVNQPGMSYPGYEPQVNIPPLNYESSLGLENQGPSMSYSELNIPMGTETIIKTVPMKEFWMEIGKQTGGKIQISTTVPDKSLPGTDTSAGEEDVGYYPNDEANKVEKPITLPNNYDEVSKDTTIPPMTPDDIDLGIPPFTLNDKDKGSSTVISSSGSGIFEGANAERVYVPNPKHDAPGGKISPNPFGNDTTAGQKSLEAAYSSLGTKQLYNVYNGKVVKFQPDNAGGYHPYEVINPSREVPTDVLRQMKKDGVISNVQYNKWIKNQ